MKLYLKTLLAFSAVAIVFGGFSEQADAHGAFKKHLEKKYENLKVSCNACHVKGQKKSVRNEFGTLFFRQLEEQTLTKRWRAIEDRAEKRTFEAEVMTPAFDTALEAVKLLTNDDDVTYADLIAAGKIENITIKEEEEGSGS